MFFEFLKTFLTIFGIFGFLRAEGPQKSDYAQISLNNFFVFFSEYAKISNICLKENLGCRLPLYNTINLPTGVAKTCTWSCDFKCQFRYSVIRCINNRRAFWSLPNILHHKLCPKKVSIGVSNSYSYIYGSQKKMCL